MEKSPTIHTFEEIPGLWLVAPDKVGKSVRPLFRRCFPLELAAWLGRRLVRLDRTRLRLDWLGRLDLLGVGWAGWAYSALVGPVGPVGLDRRLVLLGQLSVGWTDWTGSTSVGPVGLAGRLVQLDQLNICGTRLPLC